MVLTNPNKFGIRNVRNLSTKHKHLKNIFKIYTKVTKEMLIQFTSNDMHKFGIY